MLTRLHHLVSAQVDGRPFTVFRSAVGAIAILKGLHLVFRFAAQADFPHRSWLAWSPDLVAPISGAAVLSLWLGAATALAFGIRPRVAAALLAGMAGVFVLDSRLYNQHLYLLGLVCLLIAVSPVVRGRVAGREHSGTKATVEEWSPYLMKLQASFVYGFGALAKLSADFLTGRVLFTVLVGQPVAAILGGWRTDPGFLIPLSAVVVAMEVFLALAPWVPSLRPTLLAVAGPFHLGMVVLLPPDLVGFVALLVFGLIQLSILLLLFAPSERLVVVWDDSCTFCSRWVALFRRLDWLGHLDLRPLSQPETYADTGIDPEQAIDALQLRAADGSIHGGYEAVRRIAYTLPLAMLLAPWMALWPVRVLGDRAYRRTAIRRRCNVHAGYVAGTSR